MKPYIADGCVDLVTAKSHDDVVNVIYGPGYYHHLQGQVACSLHNTGDYFVASFPSAYAKGATTRVVLDADQARLLVLALAEFKKELGFEE